MAAHPRLVRALLPLAALSVLLAGIAFRLRLAPRYRVARVSQGVVEGSLELPGHLEPVSTVKIGSPLAGRVASISVSIGESVKRGQTLARLEDAELRASAAGAAAQSLAAEADVRQAQVRLADLEHEGGSVERLPNGTDDSDSDLDDAAIAMAEAQLVRAVAMLGKQRALAAAALVVFQHATLKSPIDGLVLDRSIEVGEMVSTGTGSAPLFVIGSNPSRLRLVAKIDEIDVAQIHPVAVELTTPAFPLRRFTGTITAAWPTSAPRQSPTAYQIIADVPNDGLTLWPGLSVLVKLPAHSAPQALRVPVEAVRFSPAGATRLADGRRSIWLLHDGKPERIQVSVGVVGDQLAEIRDPPLPPGTAVITGSARPTLPWKR